MGGSVGKLVDTVVGISGEIVSVTGKIIDTVGNVVDNQLGLDSIGNEIQNWGEDLNQVGEVLSGKYAARVEEIQDMQDSLNSKIDVYNSKVDVLADRLQSLLAFDEVFKMAVSNRLETLEGTEGEEITKLTKELEAMVASLKNDFDFVIGLTEGPFVQRLIGSIIMIIGGVTHDLANFAKGDWNSDLFKRLVTDALIVIGLILAIPSGGSTVPFVLAAIGAFLALDGMYANGAATGAIMGCLDFLFNDLLNLDDLVGSDFNKFNKDSDGYSEMVMWTKIAIAIAAIGGALGSGGGTTVDTSAPAIEPAVFTETTVRSTNEAMQVGTQTTMQGGTAYFNGAVTIADKFESSSVLGVKFSTYTDIYKAYSTASSAKDTVVANEQYQALKDKLAEDAAKVEKQLFAQTSQRFMNSYKDVAYFLQDQQEYVDRYIWSMTAQSMYVDPYGTTPVANIRFTPDKDTRMMSFGYEDVFNENTKAGSKGYFNSIIYG